jgi:hypothetical protein
MNGVALLSGNWLWVGVAGAALIFVGFIFLAWNSNVGRGSNWR